MPVSKARCTSGDWSVCTLPYMSPEVPVSSLLTLILVERTLNEITHTQMLQYHSLHYSLSICFHMKNIFTYINTSKEIQHPNWSIYTHFSNCLQPPKRGRRGDIGTLSAAPSCGWLQYFWRQRLPLRVTIAPREKRSFERGISFCLCSYRGVVT